MDHMDHMNHLMQGNTDTPMPDDHDHGSMNHMMSMAVSVEVFFPNLFWK